MSERSVVMYLGKINSYEDFEESDRKRHMLRLWLNNNARPLAPEFADRYGKGLGMGVPKVSATGVV